MGRRQTRTNNRAGHGGNKGKVTGARNPNGKRGDNRISIKEEGRMKRWEKAEDIPMDEEDEFFAARDKILFDDTARARARAGPAPDDGDEFDEDDEVFGLDGVGESSSEEGYSDEDVEGEQESASKSQSKTKAKPKKQNTAQSEDSDSSTDSEAELSRWGKSRSVYYADNSRVMDDGDEESRKMEEREARRLQLKMISEIGEDDWGYNDTHDTAEATVSLLAIPVAPALPTDKASLMRHIEKYDPLSLALARDWEDIAYQVIETSAAVKQVEQESPDDPSLGLMHLHHQTLLSYATTLAFYLHLQSTPKGDTSNLSQNPNLSSTETKRLRTEVISRLLTLKQSLATLEDLGFAADDDDDFDESDEDILTDEDGNSDVEDNIQEDISPYGLKPGDKVSLASGGIPRLQNLEEPWQQEKITGWMESTSSPKPEVHRKKKKKADSDLGQLEEGELEALMQDALDLEEPTAITSPPKKKKKKLDLSEFPELSEKKKKKGTTPKPVFDLVEPEFTATKSKATQEPTPGTDVDLEALGDPTQLSHTDASDKAGRRKSLRFHTSKIESTSNRRSNARAGVGGDDDLPYRDRRKEQKRHGLGEGGDDLEMSEGGDADTGVDMGAMPIGKRNRDISEQLGDDGSEGEEGYYELVRTAKKQKKEEKKAEYEAMRAAERVDPDEESSEGPRSLTRTILKNKGMTANRSPKNKAARNPRVKKKMQYAKAQKKLRSRQAVFKGGAEVAAAREGKYEGEKSGISGRVVKSIKL